MGGRPPKPIIIDGVEYFTSEARQTLQLSYYRFQDVVQEGAIVDHRLRRITINGVTYDSVKEACYKLGLTPQQFQTLFPAPKRAVFPAEINGVVYETWRDAKKALGWCRMKIYHHARQGKR